MLPVKQYHELYRKFWTNRQGLPYPEGYHCGKDLGLLVGNDVYSVCNGKIILSGLHQGYGSLNPSTPGGCIWILHNKNGKLFYACYGHINIADGIISNVNVKEGDILGSIASFKNGKDLLPHLHFGIWNSELRFPDKHWGYQMEADQKFWVDPILFLKEYGIIN